MNIQNYGFKVKLSYAKKATRKGRGFLCGKLSERKEVGNARRKFTEIYCARVPYIVLGKHLIAQVGIPGCCLKI